MTERSWPQPPAIWTGDSVKVCQSLALISASSGSLAMLATGAAPNSSIRRACRRASLDPNNQFGPCWKCDPLAARDHAGSVRSRRAAQQPAASSRIERRSRIDCRRLDRSVNAGALTHAGILGPLRRAVGLPPTTLRAGNPLAAGDSLRAGRQPTLETTAGFSRHRLHATRAAQPGGRVTLRATEAFESVRGPRHSNPG